ncbi:unnamed protein product, partial [Rotaria sp. Silwood2]
MSPSLSSASFISSFSSSNSRVS